MENVQYVWKVMAIKDSQWRHLVVIFSVKLVYNTYEQAQGLLWCSVQRVAIQYQFQIVSEYFSAKQTEIFFGRNSLGAEYQNAG